MTFNPPMRLWNGVEVTAINPAVRAMSIVVYVKAHSPMQVQTPAVRHVIDVKVHHVIRYLELEGYIPSGEGWTVKSGIVVTTP